MMQYLSKSDFKTARECATKLYYKKQKYPSLNDANEYLQLLADGGHQVGKLAQLMYPEGIEIETLNPEDAMKQTEEYLKQENITLFEPAIYINNQLVRVDILEKKGNQVNLIEVKAKGVNLEDDPEPFWTSKKDIRSKWRPYLEDIAYQTNVVNEAYPEWEIQSFLYLTNKARPCHIDGLIQYLPIVQQDIDGKVINHTVKYTGESEWIEGIRFLALIDVTAECEYLSVEIKEYSKGFLKSLGANGFERVEAELTSKCLQCEYRTEGEDSGFNQCWAGRLDDEHSILDVSRLGSWRGNKAFIKEGRMSMEAMLDEPSAISGIQGKRRQIQIENTLNNTEHIDIEGIRAEIEQLEYPLHFIDFETYQSAIPLHKGLRPHQKIAFQWSCHTLTSPEAEPIHTEFLNTAHDFPNFRFAESLMETLGNEGTIVIWSSYENTILRDIYHQMNDHSLGINYKNEALESWLKNHIRFKDETHDEMTDMHKWCEKFYFHPYMKGKTSIKYVLPAIWNNNEWLHEIDWLKQYVKKENGEIQSPYSALESFDFDDIAKEVKDGTGAMTAYTDMLYGRYKDNPKDQEKLAHMLREYCKLDTLAMVVIFKYWHEKCRPKLIVT